MKSLLKRISDSVAASRLYVITVFITYWISCATGIKCGVELYKYNLAKNSGWSLRRFKFKRSLLNDVAYVYILAIPLFLIASLFEFLSSWNA